MSKIIYVDIDGTICTELPSFPKSAVDYEAAKPLKERIDIINKLYDEGNEIHYWTARGCSTGIDWTDLTKGQLEEWGAKYHELHVGTKPHFDIYICDKSFQADMWFKNQTIMSK